MSVMSWLPDLLWERKALDRYTKLKHETLGPWKVFGNISNWGGYWGGINQQQFTNITKSKWQTSYIYVSPHFCGETYCFCPVRLSVTRFVTATPLKLLDRISWNLVGSKDTICSCAHYQEILIAWIVWELCPFELKKFPKYTTEAACQGNSSETTEQNFMKLGR